MWTKRKSMKCVLYAFISSYMYYDTTNLFLYYFNVIFVLFSQLGLPQSSVCKGKRERYYSFYKCVHVVKMTIITLTRIILFLYIVNIILVQIVPCNTVFGSPHTMVSLYTFFQFSKLFLTVHYLSHHSLKLRLTVTVILPCHLFRTLRPLRDFSMMMSPVARLPFFLLHMLVSCSVSD